MFPGEPLYRRVPSTLIVASVIAVLVGAIVLVLALGGTDGTPEQRGDLTYIEGVVPKDRLNENLVASIADITGAQITGSDKELVLTAILATDVPQPLKISELVLRWDLVADDGSTWTVATTVGKRTEVTVFSSGGFGAGTIDDTLVGGVSVLGDTIEVSFDYSAMPDFPATFDWSLGSTLRAFRSATDSPRVEDRFPNSGTESFVQRA